MLRESSFWISRKKCEKIWEKVETLELFRSQSRKTLQVWVSSDWRDFVFNFLSENAKISSSFLKCRLTLTGMITFIPLHLTCVHNVSSLVNHTCNFFGESDPVYSFCRVCWHFKESFISETFQNFLRDTKKLNPIKKSGAKWTDYSSCSLLWSFLISTYKKFKAAEIFSPRILMEKKRPIFLVSLI
jgi:hypothetical protein